MANQTTQVSVSNVGQNTETITITTNQAWLTTDISTSVVAVGANQTINVTVTSGALSPGTYNGNVTITGSGGPVANIPVTFNLVSGSVGGGTSAAPSNVAYGTVTQS